MPRKKKEDSSDNWPELVIRIKVNADPKKDDPIDLAATFFNFDKSMKLAKFEKGSRITEVIWAEG